MRRHVLVLACLLLLAAAVSARAAESDRSLSAKLQRAQAAGRRPVVGLALSGGGARGFAHVGVLKALEELGIPTDRIAGTSIGAVVGGLLACGYRAPEIEEIMLQVDWGKVLRNTAPRSRMALFERQESSRYLVSLPMEGLRIRVPTALSEGENITSLLSLLTVTGSRVESFDDLPVPFRAVATDLTTGERVVLASGSLAESIRASLAVPLLLTPLKLEGRLLADGGLSDNFPTDVARDMGSEIVIGSDVTSPLRGEAELNTPLGVADQAVSLQMVGSTRGKRELADAAILPDLANVLSTDYRRAREIIRLGYDAAMANPELREIAAGLAGWKRETPTERPVVTLGVISVEGTARYGAKRLEEASRSLTGKSLGPYELQRAMKEAFDEPYFERVRFTLKEGTGGNPDLLVKVSEERTDGFNLGARIDDKYGALGLVNLTFRELGGGDNQASFDFQVGSFSRFSGEFLHPAVPGTAFFFRPFITWSNDFQFGYGPSGDQSEFVDRRYGGEIQVGNTFRNLGAVTLGYRFSSVDFHRDQGEAVLPAFQGQVASLALRSRVDTLDRSELPDRGRLVDFLFESARSGLGGDLRFDRATLDYLGFHTWRTRHTIASGLRIGTSFTDVLPAFDQYRLGGEDYLFGLRREEVRGNHVAGIRVGYRYLLVDLGNGFFSALYLEAGADGANAWIDRDQLGRGLIPDGYLSFAARTWIGPLRMNLGLAEGGEWNVTLSIGHALW